MSVPIMTEAEKEALADRVYYKHTSTELCLGFSRYEAVRKMTPRQFKHLYDQNIRGVASFDALVDQFISP